MDKYWVKYHSNEVELYNIARERFLITEEYTHLVILPDDLIITQDDYDTLCDDIKRFDFKVLGCIANLDNQEQNKGLYSTQVNDVLDAMDAGNVRYNWMHENQRIKLMKKNPIQKVMFSGFAFMFIRRDIVKRIPFNSIAYSACCLDTRFCWDCYQLKIPIFCDFRVVGKHLKIKDGVYEHWGVGIKPPYRKLEKWVD